MKAFYSTLLLFLFSSFVAQAQLSFTNYNDSLDYGITLSGLIVAITDVNGDCKDDIVRFDQSGGLFGGAQTNMTIEYQTNTGFTSNNFGVVYNGNAWNVLVGDLNQDNIADIIIDGDVYLKSNSLNNYATNNLSSQAGLAQGGNLVDMDNDGWQDVFICDEGAISDMWLNNQTGGMVPADNFIDLNTTPASDNSGNYASVWTDIDLDGDLDLYVAKCRQSVSDPTDPRRVNALYLNDGNNFYSEAADSFGLNLGDQHRTVDFQDIDNDGDFDAFLTNHSGNNMVLENDGNGNFIDISATAGAPGVVTSLPLQGIMRDFDNNGYVDILVSGNQHKLYLNTGSTFVEASGLFNSDQIHSFAVGDINSDGFLDIYATYGTGFVSGGTDPDILWKNDGNTNNWMAVQLQGTVSNLDAVGAKAEVFGAFGRQIREVRSGESYGVVNSKNLHFGLGTTTSIDSMIISFPSGISHKFINPAINQYHKITENECYDYTTVNSRPVIETAYQADIELHAAGLIEAGTNISFKAGQLVEMHNDFEVDSLANFEATIENCP